ncbi:hypothetical protein GQ457_08G028890 [Hibiscus cannabinus]
MLQLRESLGIPKFRNEVTRLKGEERGYATNEPGGEGLYLLCLGTKEMNRGVRNHSLRDRSHPPENPMVGSYSYGYEKPGKVTASGKVPAGSSREGVTAKGLLDCNNPKPGVSQSWTWRLWIEIAPYPNIRSESGGGEPRLQQTPRTWPAIDQGQGPPVRTLSLSASDLKRKMKDEASKKGRRGSLLTGEKDCGSIPQRAYPINQRIASCCTEIRKRLEVML